MNKMEQLFLAAFQKALNPSTPSWIQWVHHSNDGEYHCQVCLKLDGCFFDSQNKPKYPQHPNCHCEITPIPYYFVTEQATSYSPYSKFDPYLFDPENVYQHGKQKAFESWGYHIEDAKWLQQEIDKQGLEQYISGNYILGKLDKNGQRLSIRVELPRKNGEGTISFITGWMVYSNGYIQLTTPYGGK